MSGNGWWPNANVITVPSGATTGQRIVIDGTNGTITMYDASNSVTGLWSATNQSFALFRGNQRIQLAANSGQLGGLVGLLLNPDTTKYSDDAALYAPTSATPPAAYLTAPAATAVDSATLIVQSATGVGAVNSAALVSSDTQDGPTMSSGTWQDLSLNINTGFMAATTGFPPAYRMVNGSTIELRGTVSRTSGGLVSGDVPITLPSGAFPNHSVYVAVGTGNGSNGFGCCRAQIGSNGNITLAWAGVGTNTFSPSFASFDGVRFDLT